MEIKRTMILVINDVSLVGGKFTPVRGGFMDDSGIVHRGWMSDPVHADNTVTFRTDPSFLNNKGSARQCRIPVYIDGQRYLCRSFVVDFAQAIPEYRLQLEVV